MAKPEHNRGHAARAFYRGVYLSWRLAIIIIMVALIVITPTLEPES